MKSESWQDHLIESLKNLNEKESLAWIERYFHPEGFCCPRCGSSPSNARCLTKSLRGLTNYHCRKACGASYNLYTGTVFSGTHLKARQVTSLIRGVCKGKSARSLAKELGISRWTAHIWRKRLQTNMNR